MDGWSDDDEDQEDDRPVRRLGEVLALLLEHERAGASGGRLERLTRAEADLRRCLEVDAEVLLTVPERELLVLERHFDREGALLRIASVDLLLLALPRYLDEPRWAGRDAEDRRLRISLTGRLARATAGLPELRRWDVSCDLIEIEGAVRRARAALRALAG